MTELPVVLVFAGNDPSGGAGLQADIQTLTSLGCHPAPVVTAITVQYALTPALVIQDFCPDSTQPSPSGTARVFIDAVSEPASRSDRPHENSASPAATGGR